MTIKQISEDINKSEALKIVAEAYGEIALIKLRKIRQNVESNRFFLEDISQIYGLIKQTASNMQASLPKKPKKTISLVMTSNYRFYGNINIELIKYFLLNSTKYRSDRLIVGKTGIAALQAMEYFHPYSKVIFKNDLPTPQELKQLVEALKDYEQVLVYFSRFRSVLNQSPMLIDITQTQSQFGQKFSTHQSLGLISRAEGERKNLFILEPELGKMLDFFDSQIKLLLLDQTFLESELARTASRLINMDQAQNNASRYIKVENRLLNSAKKSIENSKLLETFSNLFQEKLAHQTSGGLG